METLDKKRAIVSLLVIAFASLLVVAEGIAFPRMDAVVNAALPASFPPALGALPGLLFFISLSLLAFWEVVRFPEPERNAEPTPAALALVPAAPLMVILVGAAAAVLPHFQIQSAIEATLVLGSTAALLTLAGIRYRRAASPRVGIGVRADRWRQGMGVVVTVWAVFISLSYPAIVGNGGSIDIGRTWHFEGLAAFIVALGINVVFGLAVWLVVAFGLDRVAGWAVRAAINNWKDVLNSIAEGLPLLLVFVTFLNFHPRDLAGRVSGIHDSTPVRRGHTDRYSNPCNVLDC